MLKQFSSIGFALHIVLCSIGVQVMLHQCIWCGGDRVEFLKQADITREGNCCGADGQLAVSACGDEGCCQTKLLKLTHGIASGQVLDLARMDNQPVVIDSEGCIPSFRISENSTIYIVLWDHRCGPLISSRPGFVSPLRC